MGIYNMSYQIKYTKYKNKYLSLKNNMRGGGGSNEFGKITDCVKNTGKSAKQCQNELAGANDLAKQAALTEKAAKDALAQAEAKAKRMQIFAEINVNKTKIVELQKEIDSLNVKNKELQLR